MAQIVWQGQSVRGSREENHGNYNYRDENSYNRKGGDSSLAAFPLYISQNLLLAGLGLRHREPLCKMESVFEQ